MQGITKMHPFLSTNKTHTKKFKEKKNPKKIPQRSPSPNRGFLTCVGGLGRKI
jgi:hypothetical protein